MEKGILEMKEELLEQMKDSKIVIKSNEETIEKILREKKSIARFGDGEFAIICGRTIGFQESSIQLSERLKEVLSSVQNNCLIGIPNAINEFNNLNDEAESYWVIRMYKHRREWLQYLSEDYIYYSANITRPYIDYIDRRMSRITFDSLKKIWNKKDVLICEGKFSRLGIGNDLFDCCKSINRIICPAENAFEKYDEILNTIKQQPKDLLILVALGPTATVLAYDLSKEGYQALDIGHIDVEYEWYKRGALKKEKIEYKYVNEVKGGNIVKPIDNEKYKNQIISIIE